MFSEVGDMEDSVGDGEVRVKFCIICLPLGVNGLDISWPWRPTAAASILSSGGKLRFPLLVNEAWSSVGVDGNFINGGNMGAFSADAATGGNSRGESLRESSEPSLGEVSGLICSRSL